MAVIKNPIPNMSKEKIKEVYVNRKSYNFEKGNFQDYVKKYGKK